MAFPNKSDSGAMPPPSKKKGLMIAIGVGKAKGDSMPPPSMPKDPTDDSDPAGGKEGVLEKAGVIRAADHCQACQNWTPETGDCSKLPGSFEPEDACLKYFEEMSDSDDDQDDDTSAAGDTDMDASAPPDDGSGMPQ
jgi:hypothetical protein